MSSRNLLRSNLYILQIDFALTVKFKLNPVKKLYSPNVSPSFKFSISVLLLFSKIEIEPV